MGSIQIFIKLDSLFKVEVNVPAKIIRFILKLFEQLAKINLKKGSVANIVF